MSVHITILTAFWLNLRLIFGPKSISLISSLLENVKDICPPKYRGIIRWTLITLYVIAILGMIIDHFHLWEVLKRFII